MCCLSVVAAYLPTFFARRFPESNNLYAVSNALIVVLFGSLSAYFGGRLSDHLTSQNDERYRAYVPAVGSLVGFLPFVLLLFSTNFYAALLGLAMEIFLAESWMGSAIAILQSRSDLENGAGYSKGRLLAFYIFVATLIGSLSPILIGALDDGKSYRSIQISLFMVVGFSYIGSALFFFLVGSKIRTKKYSMLI